MTRAVLEGVAFGLRDGLDLMVAAGMPAPSVIRASGGGTASPVWRSILADVLVDKYTDVARTGWAVTEDDIRRDVQDLFGRSFRRFLK